MVSRRVRENAFPRDRAGFSIIELLVVIGVVAILMSLWVPSLAKSRAAARLTHASSVVRQDAVLVLQYGVDHRVFPVAMPTAWNSRHNWPVLLARTGYLPNPEAADPNKGKFAFPIHLSVCLLADPKFFLPGFTVDDPPSFGVRDSMVTYPSLKGMLVRQWEDPTALDADGFCCGRPWRTPVAMVDGSLIVGTHLDFPGDGETARIGEYGIPVNSTWRGCYGRDR